MGSTIPFAPHLLLFHPHFLSSSTRFPTPSSFPLLAQFLPVAKIQGDSGILKSLAWSIRLARDGSCLGPSLVPK